MKEAGRAEARLALLIHDKRYRAQAELQGTTISSENGATTLSEAILSLFR